MSHLKNNSTTNYKSIYMVRHSQTDYNVNKIATGQINCPINPKGIEQARKLKVLLEIFAPKPSHIIHSGLLRAKQTAAIINESMKIPVSAMTVFQEINYGDWEGLFFEKVKEEQIFNKEGPVNGESYAAFVERVHFGLTSVSEMYEMPLIVCHGGVFNAVFGRKNHVIPKTDNAMLYKLEGDFRSGNVEGYILKKYSIHEERVVETSIQSEMSIDSLTY